MSEYTRTDIGSMLAWFIRSGWIYMLACFAIGIFIYYWWLFLALAGVCLLVEHRRRSPQH